MSEHRFTVTAVVAGASAAKVARVLDRVPDAALEGPFPDGSEQVTFDLEPLSRAELKERDALNLWDEALRILLLAGINLSDATVHLQEVPPS